MHPADGALITSDSTVDASDVVSTRDKNGISFCIRLITYLAYFKWGSSRDLDSQVSDRWAANVR